MARKSAAPPGAQRGRPRVPHQHVHVLVVRVPEDMRRRLEADMSRVQAVHPSLRLSRADVLRTLLDKALRAEEA